MNLSSVIEEEITKSPFITEALQAGIINLSSLARFIQDEVQKKMGHEVSEGAISMAIKRLPPLPGTTLDKSITKFMKLLEDITVRSELVDFSFRNSDSLMSNQAKLIAFLENNKNLFFSFCKGVNETTIVCSEALSEQIREVFRNETLVSHRDRLAAVSVHLPPHNLDTYGVYYTILKQLAWKGINIVEVLSTSHEISLVIGEEEVEAVFSIILKLKRGKASQIN